MMMHNSRVLYQLWAPALNSPFHQMQDLWSYSLLTIDNVHHRLPVLPFQTREATKQDWVGLSSITSEPARIPDAESGFTGFLFTTTGLCNSDTESHIYLLDPCLYDNSYCRGGCLGPEDVPNKAAYPLMTSYRQHSPLANCHTFYLCWTWLWSPHSALALWKFCLRKDCRMNPFSSAYFNSSTGIVSLLQNFTV